MRNDDRSDEFNALLTIQSEFPALTYSLQSESAINNLFKAIRNLALYTKEQLLEENQLEVEHCFRVAKEILDKGGNLAKLAIENVFIYSIGNLLEVSFSVSQSARTRFLSFFREEYCKQINAKKP